MSLVGLSWAGQLKGQPMTTSHISWNDSLKIGIPGIDAQHEYFAELINWLAEQLPESEPAKRAHLIAELNAYAKFHFISEENRMREAGYPELIAHRDHHRQLINELSNLETTLEMRQSDVDINNLIAFLVDWFVNHTSKEDRQFADFVLNRSLPS